jgi:rhodanese-related sulfurtransferase
VNIQDLLKKLLNLRDPALELNTDELRGVLADQDTTTHLFDIRERFELAETGHLQDATHIPMGEIQHKLAHYVPDLSSEIVLYCRRGNRSYYSTKELRGLGYENVKSLRGGIQALLRDGFPLVG